MKLRFYNSTYYNPQGRETLLQVAKDMQPDIVMSNIYRHAKNHNSRFQIRDDKGVNLAARKKKEITKKKALKDLERVAPELLLEGEVLTEAQKGWQDILDDMIKAGSKDLANNKIKINGTQLTALLKIKADMELKNGNGQNDFIAAMAAAAIGKQ